MAQASKLWRLHLLPGFLFLFVLFLVANLKHFGVKAPLIFQEQHSFNSNLAPSRGLAMKSHSLSPHGASSPVKALTKPSYKRG